MPVLLLWGRDDRFVPVAIGRELAARLPRAVLHELPDCRHFPTLERPQECSRLIRGWLQGLLVSGPGAGR